MNGKLSASERALLQQLTPVAPVAPKPTPKPAPKSRKVSQGPTAPAAGFDAVTFHADLMEAARQLGVKSSPAVAREAGVDPKTVTRMASGLAPCLGTCLLLCDWAGLNPLRYLIRLNELAANDGSSRAAA